METAKNYRKSPGSLVPLDSEIVSPLTNDLRNPPKCITTGTSVKRNLGPVTGISGLGDFAGAIRGTACY